MGKKLGEQKHSKKGKNVLGPDPLTAEAAASEEWFESIGLGDEPKLSQSAAEVLPAKKAKKDSGPKGPFRYLEAPQIF